MHYIVDFTKTLQWSCDASEKQILPTNAIERYSLHKKHDSISLSYPFPLSEEASFLFMFCDDSQSSV